MFDWGKEMVIAWIPKREDVKYLGPLIGFHLPLDMKVAPLMASIKAKLWSWAAKTIP